MLHIEQNKVNFSFIYAFFTVNKIDKTGVNLYEDIMAVQSQEKFVLLFIRMIL